VRSRHHWARRSEQLDPVRDSHEISLHVSAHDFPWDSLQALSFALFRTYAVPSIGGLLAETGEFTERVQKRYDDTGILLEEVQRNGFSHVRGRAAVRRINQMHARYDISNDDLRYVLATFVVIPKRWIDDFGFRSLTPNEVAATTNYYLQLGRHMAIRDLPADFAGFERLLDDYEREHFAHDEGARRVADSTLDLMATFPPNSWAPRWVVRRFAYSLMDDPLLDAFGYPRPSTLERGFFLGAMKVRARLLRLFPARSAPKWVSAYGYFRTYPAGYDIDRLGTFPGSGDAEGAGCPAHVRASPGEAVD
jgi:hypothetical protein